MPFCTPDPISCNSLYNKRSTKLNTKIRSRAKTPPRLHFGSRSPILCTSSSHRLRSCLPKPSSPRPPHPARDGEFRWSSICCMRRLKWSGVGHIPDPKAATPTHDPRTVLGPSGIAEPLGLTRCCFVPWAHRSSGPDVCLIPLIFVSLGALVLQCAGAVQFYAVESSFDGSFVADFQVCVVEDYFLSLLWRMCLPSCLGEMLLLSTE